MPTPLWGQFEPGFASDHPWLVVLLIQWPIALAPALFTWLLPDLLRYRRGGMAWVGLGISVLLTVLLPFQMHPESESEWYWRVHPWLFGLFYVYALAGLALCAVGIFDGKRSAIWALLAVLSLLGGALADTVIWLGWAAGSPWVPVGFLGFCLLLIIGYLRRPADKPFEPDEAQAAEQFANNRTRRSKSIPRKLLREGNIHLLPVYYLLNLSDLGHEGIQNSGSYEFADHIYKNVPSGRGPVGYWIDAMMLASPACQAFRRRYLKAVEVMRMALESFPREVHPLRILAIPCGLPRDLTDLAQQLKQNPPLLERLEYWGMDVDEELLQKAKQFCQGCPVPSISFHKGNALLADTFPPGPFHVIVSTGLNEFLENPQVKTFYHNVHRLLAPGGTFYTSCTRKEQSSETLMRAFELITRYRSPLEMERLLRELSWSQLTVVQDETGLQTFVIAVKKEE